MTIVIRKGVVNVMIIVKENVIDNVFKREKQKRMHTNWQNIHAFTKIQFIH